MLNKFIYCLLLAMPVLAHGQFSVTLPDVYPPTDTVYMSPSGNDSNSGASTAPVLTFTKALQKLPFGTPGVNGGNRYGLVLLLPGTYTTATGFSQPESQWQSGNTYKNVSVQGIGQVEIVLTPDQVGAQHGLRLMGNHVAVRNLTIRNPSGIGLLLSRPAANPDEPGPSHILVEDVTIDSTGSHGLLAVNADYVWVKNTKVLRASRLGFENLPQSACSAWPSGLKLFFCHHITVENCEVAYTRGEGLNFHNCTHGLAQGNRLHDNLSNIYDDNSAKLILRRNYVYNTNLAYSAQCPQVQGQTSLSGAGMLLANEGACLDASQSPSFQFCKLVQCTGLFQPTYTFPTIDSVFIYNNIFQNCGSALAFWNGNTNIVNPNCIRNVLVAHNTFVGVLGSPGAGGGFLSFFFPDYNFVLNSYGQYNNIKFYGNLLAYDQAAHPAVTPVRNVLNNVGQFDFSFDYNGWSAPNNYFGQHDQQLGGLPLSAPIDSLDWFSPCYYPGVLLEIPGLAPWLDSDYYGNPRNINGLTAAGAIALDCLLPTSSPVSPPLRLFPNPGSTFLTVEAPAGTRVQVRDALGRVMADLQITDSVENIDTRLWPAGMYQVFGAGGQAKWLKQ